MNKLKKLRDKLLLSDEFDTDAWIKFWSEIDEKLKNLES